MQLLTPVALGPVTLANRVVSTSHQTSLVHEHLPTQDLVAYHRARAEGGVALEQRCASERLHRAAGNPSAWATTRVARRTAVRVRR